MSGPIEVHLRPLRKHATKGTYWQLRWTGPEGREDQTLGYLPDAEAEDERVKREALLRLGLSSPPSKPVSRNVASLCRDYVAHLDRTRPGEERYRQAEVRNTVAITAHVGDTDAEDVSEITFREALAGLRQEGEEDGRPPKKNTLIAQLATFRRVVMHAYHLGHVQRPAPRLPANTLPDDARPARELTQAEVRLLIAAASEHVSEDFGRLVQFAAWCPRRPVALFPMVGAHARTAQDRTPRKEARIWIERDKAGIGRGWCPLTEPALEALQLQLVEHPEIGAGDLVWPSVRGVAYTSSSVQKPLQQAVQAAKLSDVQFYDLRKFGCTMVYAAFKNLRTTQKFSGHKDVSTLLRRYIYAVPGEAEDLASTVTWSAPRLQAIEGGKGAAGTESGTVRESRRRAG